MFVFMLLLQMCLNYPFTSFSGFQANQKTWCGKNMQGKFKMSACIVMCDWNQLGKVAKTIHFTYRNMNILFTLMFAILVRRDGIDHQAAIWIWEWIWLEMLEGMGTDSSHHLACAMWNYPFWDCDRIPCASVEITFHVCVTEYQWDEYFQWVV